MFFICTHSYNIQVLVFSPTSVPSQDHDRIPIWKKLTFAVGAMPYAMCNTVVGFYLNIFLLEVAIVSCHED